MYKCLLNWAFKFFSFTFILFIDIGDLIKDCIPVRMCSNIEINPCIFESFFSESKLRSISMLCHKTISTTMFIKIFLINVSIFPRNIIPDLINSRKDFINCLQYASPQVWSPVLFIVPITVGVTPEIPQLNFGDPQIKILLHSFLYLISSPSL